MKVLIADDHQIVRYGIRILLEKKYTGVEFYEAENLKDVTDQVKQNRFDLVILDVHLNEITSIQFIRHLLLVSPHVRIIILSQLPEEVFGIHYIRAGAKAYVDKKKNFSLVSRAIDAVVNGKVFVTDEIRDEIFKLTIDGNSISKPLSDREIDVLACLLRGMHTSEIATELNLQSTTVSTYKHRIFEKLKTTNLFLLKELVSVMDLGISN